MKKYPTFFQITDPEPNIFQKRIRIWILPTHPDLDPEPW